MSNEKSDATSGASSGKFSRRAIIVGAGAAGLATPIGIAQALGPVSRPAFNIDESAICRVSGPAPVVSGPRKKISFSWNPAGVCLAPIPMGVDAGIFDKFGLDIDLVSYGGSTDQLLEAIATGKSDAGVGMALRWLKPLEQGFDVKITAGTHGGCLRLLAPKDSAITKIEDLKGKTIAAADMAGPDKNFFSILLAKKGIDPIKDVEWRVFPGELVRAAVDKGEAHALVGSDPRTYLWLKDGKLREVSSNLVEQYAHLTCCVIGLRGSLVRDDRDTASRLTRAILASAQHAAHNPDDAAKSFQKFAPNASLDDLKAMVQYHTHHHNPVGDALKKELAFYTEQLKAVSVIKPGLNVDKFADRIFADVLA